MRSLRGVAFGVVALALAGIAAQQSLLGQDAAPKAEAKAAKPRAKSRGRLPPHYGAVVDPEQKEKIYGIQNQYKPQIEALQAQLVALREKQAAEIDAVLTPEQKEKVKELAAAAKAKRAKAAESKPADDTPKSSDAAAPPANAKAKKAS